ncbi:MAG: immunoglobulin domain-containing protein, partial [Phycisphaerales bacterium]|nr:immunoglobulin domain-containing protein [Phycisphaerales bacterium]
MLKYSLAVLLLSAPAIAQSTAVWEAGPAMPTGGVAKTHAVGIELGGQLFVMGGPPWTAGDNEDGSVYSMPLGGSSWTEEIGFDGIGYILGQGGGVDSLGRIIIFGGDRPDEPGNERLPFEWNSVEGPWTDHAARGTLAPAIGFAYCTDDSSRIYSLGGGNGVGASASNPNSAYCERFIGNLDIWEPIAPMPTPVANAAACFDGLGHILVIGGVSADGSSRLNQVLQYDIASDTWSSTAVADMPIAVSDHKATLGADGRVYVLGGTVGPIGTWTATAGVMVYNPLTNEWADGPEMSVARRNFASLLGSDDRIYVFGGENLSGGSYGTESLYTTPCPRFSSQPVDTTVWAHTTIGINCQTLGGGVITYQWFKDGQPLADGPADGGGVIAGSQTSSLSIQEAAEADEGLYWVVAMNSCGEVTSSGASVVVRVPPSISTNWTWTNLHPSVAESSYATAVDGGVQVGNAIFDTPEYNNIDHPWKWSGSAASGVNLTPSGSQGGSVLDFKGDKLVGWWWWPYQCYISGQWYTCYLRRGAWWNLNGSFHATNYSGYEYTLMSATDGVSVVGTGTTDDASGNVYNKAVIWQAPTHEFAYSLHPTGYRNSSASAVDGDDQYGTASLPFAIVHAARWSGTSSTFVDMHPSWASNSAIVDASDGQQVGVVNQWSNSHAVIWSGTPESIIDIHPDGALSSTVSDCEGGLQLGAVNYDDGTGSHPGIWAGSASTFVDLSAVVPAGYSGLSLTAIDVAPDGTISLVGSARNISLNRTEAVLLTATPDSSECTADFTGDGVLDVFDVFAFLDAFNLGELIADFTGDGLLDVFDVFAFL